MWTDSDYKFNSSDNESSYEINSQNEYGNDNFVAMSYIAEGIINIILGKRKRAQKVQRKVSEWVVRKSETVRIRFAVHGID